METKRVYHHHSHQSSLSPKLLDSQSMVQKNLYVVIGEGEGWEEVTH